MRATSPVRTGEGQGEGQEFGCGLVLGFGVGRGLGAVFELVGEPRDGDGLGLREQDRCTRSVDALDARTGDREGFGFEDRCEGREREIVEIAQVE